MKHAMAAFLAIVLAALALSASGAFAIGLPTSAAGPGQYAVPLTSVT
jgi:thiol:disulfide interchange protein